MAMNRVQLFQSGLALSAFLQRYGSEAAYEAKLLRSSWLQVFVCPRCAATRVATERRSRTQWQCADCHRQTTLRAGTVFGHTWLPKPLDSSVVHDYAYATAQTIAGQSMRFTDTKSETLNLRVSPTFKQVLKEAADHEQRSMVNMLEVLLGNYCDRKGIVPLGQKAAHQQTRTGRRAHVGAGV